MVLAYKIGEYAESIDSRIEREIKTGKTESINSSIAAGQREAAYRDARRIFYQLFPEIFGEYREYKK